MTTEELCNLATTAGQAIAGDPLAASYDTTRSSSNDGDSLLGSAAGEFALRITAGPCAGRVVRLSAAKCTVGSAPYCTLRLHGVDVDPVQCVILHGRGKSIVRRWSGSTLLNDRTFDDMPLKTGDRLSIGPVEMQILSLPGKLQVTLGAARRFGTELQSDRRGLDALTARLELANSQGRRRLRAAVAKLRKYQLRMAEMEGRRRLHSEERAQLELQRSVLETQQHDVQARLDECERRRQTLAAEEKLLQEQAERLRELAKQSSRDREAAQAEIARRREELAASEARLRQAEAALTEQLAQAASEQARTQRDSAELLRWENQLKEQAAALAQRTAQDAARACELETRERAVGQKSEELSRRQAELDRCSAERAKQEASLAAATAQRDQALATREKALQDHESAVAKEAAAAAKREQTLAEQERSLAELQRTLADREAKLAEQARTLAEQQQSLAAEAAGCAAREQKLGVQAAALAEREQALEIRLAIREAEIRTLTETAAQEQRAAAERKTGPLPETARQSAELQRRAEELDQRSAELDHRAEGLNQRSSEIDRQAAELSLQGDALTQQFAEAARCAEAAERREEEAAARHAEAQRRQEEVAARCEALKRHWHELVQRERLLDERAARVASQSLEPAASSSPEAALSLETAVMLEQMRDRLAGTEAELAESQSLLSTARAEAMRLTERLEVLQAERDAERADNGRPGDAIAVAEAMEAGLPTDQAGELARVPTAEDTAQCSDVAESDDEVASRAPADVIAEGLQTVETSDATQAEDAVDSEDLPHDEEAAQQEVAAVLDAGEKKAGESAADVLRRLGLTAVLEDDDHQDEPAPVRPVASRPVPPVAAPAAQQSSKPSNSASGEPIEDESINDYMAQLLQRLGVRQDERNVAAGRQEMPREVVRPSGAEMLSRTEPEPQVPQQPLEAKDFKARSVAAERTADLSALRELANVNARTAVATHQIKTTETASRWKGRIAAVLAATGLGAGAAAFLGYSQALPTAVGGLVLALLFGVKSIGLRRKVKKSTRSLDDVLQRSAAKLRSEPEAGDEQPKA